ncbi:MAG: transposase, IS66 family [Methyloprofundus sp.]|nr:MAG: transposase, IS66 family [Methyloprofundus sp.]BCG63991.1 MAG: transposase, IS66 family [Methyloprofundus sp.]
MQLTCHDLSQLNEEELLNLSEEELRRLSIKLLNDLKEARECLSQSSRNSSRPPSSDAPWDKYANDQKSNEELVEPEEETESPGKKLEDKVKSPSPEPQKQDSENPLRKPGKQPGAQGFGRQQKIVITDYQHHYPQFCACCSQPLKTDSAIAYTAFETLDIEWADTLHPGIYLTNTKHVLYETTCSCHHITRKEVHRSSHESLPEISCSEWRLVGPGLASLIVCLSYRMRLSRERVQEFLHDWLGIRLSIGTINNTLHESGAAAMPIEEELVQEIVNNELLHVDETSWMELTTFLWLWVFTTDSVTAYWIASRSAELIENILGEDYVGWLMSDGYQVYRRYPNRMRCWAHLLRKAEGLKESLDKEAQLFGRQTLDLLGMLITSVRDARNQHPDEPLSKTYQLQLLVYQQLCVQMQSHTHKKSAALATEMLNDWEAIFRVLDYPQYPLTNNEAERALRHWVILRGICYGTRTEEGSRVFAILISVIETCRKRNQSPWVYLAAVIASQRTGSAVPALPSIKVSE